MNDGILDIVAIIVSLLALLSTIILTVKGSKLQSRISEMERNNATALQKSTYLESLQNYIAEVGDNLRNIAESRPQSFDRELPISYRKIRSAIDKYSFCIPDTTVNQIILLGNNFEELIISASNSDFSQSNYVKMIEAYYEYVGYIEEQIRNELSSAFK